MDAPPPGVQARIARLAELIADLARTLAEAPEPQIEVQRPVLLDVVEAARMLGISRAKLYDGPIRRGELLTVLIDSRRLVPRAALDAYVADLVAQAS